MKSCPRPLRVSEPNKLLWLSGSLSRQQFIPLSIGPMLTLLAERRRYLSPGDPTASCLLCICTSGRVRVRVGSLWLSYCGPFSRGSVCIHSQIELSLEIFTAPGTSGLLLLWEKKKCHPKKCCFVT